MTFVQDWVWIGWSASLFSWLGLTWLSSVFQHEKTLSWKSMKNTKHCSDISAVLINKITFLHQCYLTTAIPMIEEECEPQGKPCGKRKSHSVSFPGSMLVSFRTFQLAFVQHLSLFKWIIWVYLMLLLLLSLQFLKPV